MFNAIIEKIKAYDTVILHRHNWPDGDALGSQIGLKHIILENFPGKQVYCVGDKAGRLSFMEDSVMDELPDSAFEGALSVILDCGAAGLVSDKRFSLAAERMRIDHHVFSGQFAETEYIDSDCESCCGIICRIAMESGLKINKLAAASLFTGMVTDSGRFRYDATTADTFRQAAYLMEQGLDLNEIYLPLYADDFDSKLLRAQFTLKIRFTEKNVAYIYTTRSELESSGQDTFTISRGMVNTMADIKGVDIWVNFTETDSGVLCELRSSKKSVVHIAVKHGGGGHDKACGATLADREEAMEMLRELDEMMED